MHTRLTALPLSVLLLLPTALAGQGSFEEHLPRKPFAALTCPAGERILVGAMPVARPTVVDMQRTDWLGRLGRIPVFGMAYASGSAAAAFMAGAGWADNPTSENLQPQFERQLDAVLSGVNLTDTLLARLEPALRQSTA